MQLTALAGVSGMVIESGGLEAKLQGQAMVANARSEALNSIKIGAAAVNASSAIAVTVVRPTVAMITERPLMDPQIIDNDGHDQDEGPMSGKIDRAGAAITILCIKLSLGIDRM